MNDCEFYDADLDCCKLFSDWMDPMPFLQPCIEGPCHEKCPVAERNREIAEYEKAKNKLFSLIKKDIEKVVCWFYRILGKDGKGEGE